MSFFRSIWCIKIERLSSKIMFWQKDASSMHQGFEINSATLHTEGLCFGLSNQGDYVKKYLPAE